VRDRLSRGAARASARSTARLITYRAGGRLTVAATALVLSLTGCPAAFASNGDASPTNQTTTSDYHGTLKSQVSFASSSGSSGTTKHLVPSDTTYSLPPCWYEPFYSPDELKAYLQDQYDYYGKKGAETVYNYYNELQSQASEVNYHKGDKGKWWGLVPNPNAQAAYNEPCAYTKEWIWVGPQSPAPPGSQITPAMLSKVAYSATMLPEPELKLSPSPAHQVVNLPTYVSFDDKDPLTKVWTTASLAALNIAATVVAHPTSLRVTTDDPDASPQSCTYALSAGAGGDYKVNSADANCNITFLRASKGTYTITAHLTWRVSWTPTANPNAGGQTPMPDGYSDSDPQTVTIHEIQTVNR
jgi:enoyl reductase